MADSKSEERCSDTSKTVVKADVDNVTEEIMDATMNNSSTFDFAERSPKTDFTLVVEGKRFHVAKIVLALASPVFDKMFESGFKEGTSDVFELPGKTADAFQEFLLAIYPSTADVISKVTALNVLPLAEEYQVVNLKRRCEDALLGSIDARTSIEELYRIIIEAHLYNLNKLLKNCVSFVCEKSVEDIQRTNREIILPAEPLSDILHNLNKRLVSKVKELESSNAQLTEQLQNSQTLNNYVRRTLTKSQFLKLDEDLVWTGKSWIFTMPIRKQTQITDKVTIWNMKMKIDLYIQNYKYHVGETLQAKITNDAENEIDCKVITQFVVLNKMPTEEHRSVNQTVQFCSGTQSAECDVFTLETIQDPKKGFVYEEKVQLEVNILMSEPQKVNT